MDILKIIFNETGYDKYNFIILEDKGGVWWLKIP